jgi:sugar phosphate isomerase/epimerase
MHVHDNSGAADEHKCPGEGSLDFPALLSECKAA